MKYKVTRIFIVDANDSIEALHASRDLGLCIKVIVEPFEGTGYEELKGDKT